MVDSDRAMTLGSLLPLFAPGAAAGTAAAAASAAACGTSGATTVVVLATLDASPPPIWLVSVFLLLEKWLFSSSIHSACTTIPAI